MDPDRIQEILQQDWLSPQGAILLAGISYAWLRLLGERGQIATLQTPLGRLYKRADVERVRTQRDQARSRSPRGVPATGSPAEPNDVNTTDA